MNIAILGSGGFVGSNLYAHLLRHTNHHITLLSTHPERIGIPEGYRERVMILRGNVFKAREMEAGLEGIEVAAYLVHMMGQSEHDFYDLEAKAAETFCNAALKTGLRRVVYLSGLGRDDDLSKHLASRHNTGDILRKNIPEVIELRASMIIGKGSISFEIVKELVRKLPVMTMPPLVNHQNSAYWST